MEKKEKKRGRRGVRKGLFMLVVNGLVAMLYGVLEPRIQDSRTLQSIATTEDFRRPEQRTSTSAISSRQRKDLSIRLSRWWKGSIDQISPLQDALRYKIHTVPPLQGSPGLVLAIRKSRWCKEDLWGGGQYCEPPRYQVLTRNRGILVPMQSPGWSYRMNVIRENEIVFFNNYYKTRNIRFVI